LLSTAMMFVQSPMQFYVLRFLLGVAEAGFYPGVIYYFARWFPPCHRGRAVSRFFAASPAASIVMGGVSGSLLALDGQGGLQGWQWLFLVQGLPTVLFGLVVLKFLPENPAIVAWLTPAEKDWIQTGLAREQARIGEPSACNVLAAFRNPRVLLLGAIGFLLIGAISTFILSAPMVLAGATDLDNYQVGYLVSLGGIVGTLAIIVAGNHADKHGDRFLDAFRYSIVLAGAFLVIALAPAPIVVMVAYLAFAATCFTTAMLTSSGWAEVLHFRELAVGAAAVNTLSQIGAFVTPFGWGLAKDATGSYNSGLVTLLLMTVMMAGLILGLRQHMRHRTAALLAARAT
jgi:ACS family tartrate transporter-like MFS transporter